MINTKNADPNLLSINKISYKNTDAVVYSINDGMYGKYHSMILC